MELIKELIFTGTQVNYFIVCPRKLWFFSKGIVMEQTSDLVYFGSLIHQEGYKRDLKEVMIDNKIKIDFLRKSLEIHEVKKSKKLKKAHFYQVLYYLYYLKKKGLITKGIINYPLSRKIEKVELTSQKEKEIESILARIKQVLKQPFPPYLKAKSYCRSCSYYPLCFA